eukprot:PhM_4_TR13681/c0_g1_i1/m.75395
MGGAAPLWLCFVAQGMSVIGDAFGQRTSRVAHKQSRRRFIMALAIVSPLQMLIGLGIIQLIGPSITMQVWNSYENGTKYDFCEVNPDDDRCFHQGPLTIPKALGHCPYLPFDELINIFYYLGEAMLYAQPLGLLLLVMASLSSSFIIAPLQKWLDVGKTGHIPPLVIVFGIVGAVLCIIEREPKKHHHSSNHHSRTTSNAGSRPRTPRKTLENPISETQQQEVEEEEEQRALYDDNSNNNNNNSNSVNAAADDDTCSCSSSGSSSSPSVTDYGALEEGGGGGVKSRSRSSSSHNHAHHYYTNTIHAGVSQRAFRDSVAQVVEENNNDAVALTPHHIDAPVPFHKKIMRLMPLMVPFALLAVTYALYFVMQVYYTETCKMNTWGFNAFDQVALPPFVFGMFFLVDSFQWTRTRFEEEADQHESFAGAFKAMVAEQTGNRFEGFWTMFVYRGFINARAMIYTYLAVLYDLNKVYLQLTLIRVALSWAGALVLVLVVPKFIRTSHHEKLTILDPVNLSLKIVGTVAIVASLVILQQ